MIFENDADTKEAFVEEVLSGAKNTTPRIIAAFTLHDHDFSRVLRNYVENIMPHLISENVIAMDAHYKTEFFTHVWNKTCSALHYFSIIDPTETQNGLYPSGYMDAEAVEKYMQGAFRAWFDSDAQQLYDANTADSSGSDKLILFVDDLGTVTFN